MVAVSKQLLANVTEYQPRIDFYSPRDGYSGLLASLNQGGSSFNRVSTAPQSRECIASYLQSTPSFHLASS